MKLPVFPCIILLASQSLPAQQNGIGQTSEIITVPTGDKLLRWHGHTGRSYFVQVSDANEPLGKWNWAPVIEGGNDTDISYEVDGTAAKSFFRLKYTDQVPGPAETLDTADFDNDGIINIDEIVPPPPLLAGNATDPLDPDTDHDGMSDGYERLHGLDANDDGSTDPDNGPDGDPDGDGLTNAEELALGTQPKDPDSDHDGLNDGDEGALGTNPLNNNSDGDFLDGEPLLDGDDADPLEILVNWRKAPESSYLLIDVEVPAGESDIAQDLNDNSEVLFGTGIWAGGTWISKVAPEITGVIPGTVSVAFPDGIGYIVPPGDWSFFNNDRKLLQISVVQPTDGPGVDSPAPSPVFWADGQSSPSLVYETADLWEDPYWQALAVGVSTSGDMVALVTPLQPPSESTPATWRLDRFDASGVLIGSMDGSDDYHPEGYWLHGDVSPSGWVAFNLARDATDTQPAAYKVGLWDASSATVSLPAEADAWGYPVRLADLPNSKTGLVAGGSNGVTQSGRVFLPDAADQMQYSTRLSSQNLQLFAGDGTAMSDDNQLWRNGKLIPLRDLCPRIGELLDDGWTLFPLKANNNGTYLIQAVAPDGTTETKLMKSVTIVPDANMAGVIGDEVASLVMLTSVKHFVTPKQTEELNQPYVILKAVGVTADQITPGNPAQIAEWEGGEAVPNEPLKRRVKRNSAEMTEVRINSTEGGAMVAQMDVWVVWATVTTTNGAPVFESFANGVKFYVPSAADKIKSFKFKIEPAQIFTQDLQPRPNFLGKNKKTAPGNGNTHTINPLNGACDTANLKWDVSRQFQFTLRNPNNIPKADMLQDGVPEAFLVDLSPGDDVPVKFPQSDIEGNDDAISTTGAIDEEANPYQAVSIPGLDHEIGQLSSVDGPSLLAFNNWGAAGRSLQMDFDFREFARLELWDGKRTTGQFWYRISEQKAWHHHMHVEYDPATSTWKDSGSSPAAN